MNSLLGSYITKEYELLHLVLSHLPLRDLNAASKVCRYTEVNRYYTVRSEVLLVGLTVIQVFWDMM